MLKKFLAFFGLSKVELKDGKATLEMTEEQMEASGKIIDERDQALASVESLTAELANAKQKHADAQTQLTDAQSKVTALEAEKTALTDQVKALQEGSAEETTELKTDTNSVKKKEAYVCVTSENASIEENIVKVQEAYL